MRILFHYLGKDPEPWLAELRDEFPQAQLRVWQEGDNDAADYAVVWKPPQAMLQQRADLKAVFNIGAGVDAILQFGDTLPAGVPIVRLDDAGMGVQMAEYVTHAVLRYFRRFDEYDRQARAGQWRQLRPHDRRDFSIGILGLGVLGSQVAAALAHHGFPLHGWSSTLKDLPGVFCHAGQDGLERFLSSSRVLVCLLPLTADTVGILNQATLATLPQGAYLINIARGPHLVEEDLLTLVQGGHIAGATLDVFREEPLPPAHPFWQEPRITITPHVAAITERAESIRQIAGKIRSLERGEAIAGVVDLIKGY
ncbi:MAG: glyoxylate/hydroxypyruvate reductase A [Pseudomonadota bacterium]